MANIFPTTTATGSEPKILDRIVNNNNFTTVGTIRGSANKTQGGLDFQNGENAGDWKVNDATAGYNGVRTPAGLSATDLTNAIVFVHFSGNAWNRIDINTRLNNGFVFHLITGTGFTNVRHYQVGGNDTYIGQAVGRHVLSIDANYPGAGDTGTFNPASVDQIAFTNDTNGGYSSNYCWFYPTRFCRVYRTKAGAIGIYGTNPSFEDYVTQGLTVAWGMYKLAPNTYQIIAPFKIGHATAGQATTFTDNGSTLVVPVSDKDAGDYRFQWTDTSIPFFLDLQAGDSITLNNTTFSWGIKSLFDFDSNVGATVTLNGVNFSGMGNITLGSDVSGTATFNLGTSKTIINGANLNGSTINNNCDLLTATNLSNIYIDGDLRINIGANATLTFDNVTVTGQVWNDDPNSTLTINATGNSSLTAGDPGTGVGQTNIQTVINMTITCKDKNGNPIQGVEVSIIRTSDRTALLDGVATDASGQVTHTYSTSELVDIMFAHINYKPVISDKYDYQLPTTDSTLEVTLFDDSNYENPP